jgi:hypothetical protein
MMVPTMVISAARIQSTRRKYLATKPAIHAGSRALLFRLTLPFFHGRIGRKPRPLSR